MHFVSVLLLALFAGGRARPQQDCDDIFVDCQDSDDEYSDNYNEDIFGYDYEEDDESETPIKTLNVPPNTENQAVNGKEDKLCTASVDSKFDWPEKTTSKCFESVNEIENSIFDGDTRSAFNDCDPSNSCDKYADAGYACAHSWACSNNTIITDGKGLIDIRSTSTSSSDSCAETTGIIDLSDKKCAELDKVCCKHPNWAAKKCNTQLRPTGERERCKESFAKCGRTGVTLGLTGLQGDQEKATAQPGEFPHMCAIYMLGVEMQYVGGASLIAPNKLLTVAHKFYVMRKQRVTDYRGRLGDFLVRCGEHNVRQHVEWTNPQETVIREIHLHPEYDPRKIHNNIAVLETEENFVYRKDVGPVCLPRPGQNFDDQTQCWSSGWGSDDFRSNSNVGEYMKKVKMPVVGRAECEQRMRQTERFRNKPNFRIHDSWLCVGGEPGSDTCKGDGGSPHVCKDDNDRYVQVGAVAWGVGCGSEVPSVYSSVPAAMCWVDWVMSCRPLAKFNIDLTTVDDLDPRETQGVTSANGFSQDECTNWLDKHPNLQNECPVDYYEIDERGS